MEGKPELKLVSIDSSDARDMVDAMQRGFKKLQDAKAVVVLLVMKDGTYCYERSPIWTSDLALLSFMLNQITHDRFYEKVPG